MSARSAFVRRYGEIYENSPWVAESVAAQSTEFADTGRLAAALENAVNNAPREQRLALIREHPQLAGRAAGAGELTAHSSTEQASAGLDRCTAEELARITRLNEAYLRKFGFPFVMAVRGRSRDDILAAFERRLGNPPDIEFDTAISEIHKIARLRLAAMEQDVD